MADEAWCKLVGRPSAEEEDMLDIEQEVSQVAQNDSATTIDPARVQTLKREGLGPTEIATKLGISRMSVYRVLKENRHGPV
jgi:DNA invertase Pin-like site-specific DNA recombinase